MVAFTGENSGSQSSGSDPKCHGRGRRGHPLASEAEGSLEEGVLSKLSLKDEQLVDDEGGGLCSRTWWWQRVECQRGTQTM